jgi:hypothetical protein
MGRLGLVVFFFGKVVGCAGELVIEVNAALVAQVHEVCEQVGDCVVCIGAVGEVGDSGPCAVGSVGIG